MNIIHIRIDDRLIHGRVAAMWTGYLGITRIMVVDDEAAHDDIIKISLKLVVPSGISLSVLPVERAGEKILGRAYGKQRLMMIAKTPQTLIRLIKQGVSLCSVNVGNLSNGAHKFCVTDAIYISMEQLYYFEKIAESGVNLVIQKFPEDNVLDFIDLASEKALKNNMCAIQSL